MTAKSSRSLWTIVRALLGCLALEGVLILCLGSTVFLAITSFQSDTKPTETPLSQGSFPQTSAAISPQNAGQIKERYRIDSAQTKVGVYAVAWSPDSQLLAAGFQNGNLRLWDATSGREQQSLVGHAERVQSIAFSPDGKTLASGSADKTLKLWDVSSGRALSSIAHSGPVREIIFSPDGRLIVSSDGIQVKLFDMPDAAARRAIPCQDCGVSVSSDGRWLAIAESKLVAKQFSTAIRICDFPDMIQCRSFTLERTEGGLVRFAPNAQRLALARSGNAKLIDASTGREIEEFVTTPFGVPCIAFSPDGAILASGGGGHAEFGAPYMIVLWDMTTLNQLRRVDGSDLTFSMAYSPDGRLIASGHESGAVRLWGVSP